MKQLFMRLICIMSLALALTGCGSDDGSVSQQEFDDIDTGMSYAEVVEAVGGEGTKNTNDVSLSVQGVPVTGEITSYSWRGPNEKWVTCIFVDGSMFDKSLHN